MIKNLLHLALALLALTSYAQTDSLAFQYLDEVDVVARRNALISESLRIVKTISKEEIATFPAQNINELLDHLPGIDVRQRGSNGVQADLSLRGGSFDQVIILINGVNFTNVQTGHLNMDLPVDLEMIDRIEILRGSAMNLSGLTGFSGAINIITGDSDDNKVQAAVTAGDHGFLSPKLGLHYKADKWKLSGNVSHNRSDGYVENTDYKFTNLFFQSTYTDKQIGKLNFQLGSQQKAFGANSFYTVRFPDQYEATNTQLASLQWEKHFGKLGLSSSAFYRRHQDRFELFRGYKDAPSWYRNHNHHVTHVVGGTIKTSWFTKNSKTSAGIEVRNEKISSNVLGDALESPISVPNQPDSVKFIYQKDRTNINYFVEQAFFLQKFSASVGLSGNYNSMFGNDFYGGLNMSYDLQKDLKVYANVNSALRLPTFTDLYYKSPTQESNPDLKPEKSLTTELGVTWTDDVFRINALGYYRQGQDIIDRVKAPADDKWKSLNHSEVNALGGEITLAYSPNEFLKNIELSYAFTDLDKESGALLSRYALDYLKHKVSILATHRIYKGVGATWQIFYQSREGAYANLDGDLVNYDPFWMVNSRLYWQGEKIYLFIEATNLFDVDYYDYGGVPQPGIWAKAGVRFDFAW